MSLWQTQQPQRHTPCGRSVMPNSGRPSLTDGEAEKPYPGRWRT